MSEPIICCVCEKEITENTLFDSVVWIGDTEYYHRSCGAEMVSKYLWATRVTRGDK